MGITWQERLLPPLGRGSEWINDWMNERLNVWSDGTWNEKGGSAKNCWLRRFQTQFCCCRQVSDTFVTTKSGFKSSWRSYHLLITVTVSFNLLSTLTERQNYFKSTCPSLQPVKAELLIFVQSETSRFSGVPTKPPNDSNGFMLNIQLYFVLVSYLWTIKSISNYLYIWLTGSCKTK